MEPSDPVDTASAREDGPSEDIAAAWRQGLDYTITIDTGSAYYDAAERLHVSGELHNLGPRPIEIGRHAKDPILIGARVRSMSGEVRPGVEARAGIARTCLMPGEAAPFRMTVPGFQREAHEDQLQFSLVYEGRFWFCDNGFPATILGPQGSTNPQTHATSSPSTIEPAAACALEPDAQIADKTEQAASAPTILDSYIQEKLGTGRQATYDDVWNCYRLLLNREADPDGFAAYAAGVRQGMSVNALVTLFLASAEFAYQLTKPQLAEPRQIRLNGLDFFVPEPQTPAERQVLETGTYKRHLSGALSSILAPGQFILDIGAGVGEFSLLAASKAGPRGRVVAFEPLARNMRLLLANCRANDVNTIDVLPFAASDSDGFLTIIRRGAILTARDPLDEDFLAGMIDVAYARTIDSVIPTDQRVDVVRVCLDGFDFRALRGAEQMLSRCKPHLFADWAPGLLHEFSGIEPDDYLKLLVQCGYNRFTAIAPGQGAIDLGADIDKLKQMPAKIGAANVEFYAQAG